MLSNRDIAVLERDLIVAFDLSRALQHDSAPSGRMISISSLLLEPMVSTPARRFEIELPQLTQPRIGNVGDTFQFELVPARLNRNLLPVPIRPEDRFAEPKLPRLVAPRTKKYQVQAAGRLASAGVLTATLPWPTPRFVNAATLKALLCKPRETLFQAVGNRWRICPDDHQIDLTDPSQQYRLGEVGDLFLS